MAREKVNRIVGFIPARGGSKSIPLKNVRPFNGKPLICYSIDAAMGCEAIDLVVVSTDDQQIANVVSERYGNNSQVEVFWRDPNTATDTASTESAMLDFAEKREFDHIILMQATSPFTAKSDLEGAIDHYFSAAFGGLISVTRQKRFFWNSDSEGAVPLNYDPQQRPRRQDFSGQLVENGAFYISSRENLIQSKCRVSEPYTLWEMDEVSYFEMDEPSDWVIGENLMRLKNSQESPVAGIASAIKLVITDVDGVLTDAGMYYDNEANELKKFNTRDGKGFELLRKAGIKVGIITAEDTEIVARRGKKLQVDYLYQGVKDKVAVLNEILQELSIPAQEVAYIGDDLNDLGVLSKVGLSACPSNAEKEVFEVATYHCQAPGGGGCFRELANLILSHR